MSELNKYVLIKKLVDSNGNKKNEAIKLDSTAPTINRLIIKYKTGGKNDFVHKNRNRKPAITISIKIKN